MKRVITRAVPASLAQCELTHLKRQPIDVDVARRQHGAYEDALRRLGYEIFTQPPLDDYPDSVFVEDTALVLDEIAVITRMGAASRQGETDYTAKALADYRELVFMEAPATLEGGDVLRIGHRIFVGVGGRTNEAGVTQLADLIGRFGYTVQPIAVNGALHLKSAVSCIAPDTVLANPEWIDTSKLGARVLSVARREPAAANVLATTEALLVSDRYPDTRAMLERRGFPTETLTVTELHKAEAGLTCMSLLL